MDRPIAGADWARSMDALFVNAPLRDYLERPRVNDFTLPVLGMAYIATFAAQGGFNVGVLDAEAHGLSIEQTVTIVNDAKPRWVGLNLLAPTYELSARIAAGLDHDIKLMVGGHHARAMPREILHDPRMLRCEALVIGEAETRVFELLHDQENRSRLPGVMWLDPTFGTIVTGEGRGAAHLLAPNIDELPFVGRRFLQQDPYRSGDGRWEAAMVGARGCPYDCSFCGAALSANPDIAIRVRQPANIIAEMCQLKDEGVTAFRFVDDLFLGAHRVIRTMMDAFRAERIGDWAVWDATGRINVLDRVSDKILDSLVENGLREVALGIESGSERMLARIDKRITPDMTIRTVRRLVERGIDVKGYFILGMPTETVAELDLTVGLVHRLWDETEHSEGTFRSSVFEYRPYPGTADWSRLMESGKYGREELLAYTSVDLSAGGGQDFMQERDEFNFSVNLQLSDAPLEYVRQRLVDLTRVQFERRHKRALSRID
jgi:anaerobic magnesium-protoporphyrin IX monomethyl ester cyclase